MKRLFWATTIALVLYACAAVNKPTIPIPSIGMVVIDAQSLPYAATVTWNVSPSLGVTGYNCYLDGALVTSVGLVTACTVSVPTFGQHTIGVTAVGAAAIPPESPVGACDPPLPQTCIFQLGQPAAAGHVKIK
jgi:hypothetical protein